MRMPQTLFQIQHPGLPVSGATALDLEVMAEKAAVLGSLGRRVEQAVAALNAFDTDASIPSAARPVLVDNAAEAVWQLLVHQDACGVVDSERLLRDFAVPDEVRNRVGARPRAVA